MSKNYRNYLPPEWAPQSGVMLTWPHSHGDWAGQLHRVEPVFVEIAYQIGRREKVLIVCYDNSHCKHVSDLLARGGINMSDCLLRVATSNDSWARDHGPLTVTCQDEPLMLDFGFNGWGGKYGYELDNLITRKLYLMDTFGATSLQTVNLILEGGSIEVDGSGTLLTTERCLLAPTRNRGYSRVKLEKELKELLGINRVLWLRHGFLAGDDTDSHIDTLARFCDPHTIAYVECNNSQDEHYSELKAMEEELTNFRATNGKPYRLIPLPMPSAKLDADGNRLPATYANFLIINGAVLVPTYADPADEVALDLLKRCFPGREIIAIHCLPLIHQFGSLHCVTMQLPEGVL